MKKFTVLSLTVLFAVSVVNGQVAKTDKEQKKETKKVEKSERVPLKKLEGTAVSAIAKNNFATDFGKVTNAQWKRVGTYDEVIFTSEGKEKKAFYDYNGKLVGTVQDIKLADIPEKGQQAIKDKYKDYTVGKVFFYDDNEANETDMILYGIQFDDADNYFVELTKDSKKIIVRVDMAGELYFFKQI